MLGLLLAQAVAPAATPPRPANDPATWVQVADYPKEAIDRRQEGPVAFSLRIDAAGNITNCTTKDSDSIPALAATTCTLVTARALFVPAPDAKGQAVSGTFASRIRWVYPTIKEAPPPATVALPSMPADRVGASDLWVDADGIVTRCEPIPNPYANTSAPPDICAAYHVGSRYSVPATVNGKPQKRKIRIRIETVDTYVR